MAAEPRAQTRKPLCARRRYRPIQKYAALKCASHEIESEAFRFRTRTRPYYASKSTASGKGHRQLFAAACNRVLATHLSGDVRVGAARLADTELWVHHDEGDSGAGISGERRTTSSASRAGVRSRMVAPADGAGSTVPPVAPSWPSVVSGGGTAAGTRRAEVAISPGSTKMLSADDYTQLRALPALREAQAAAPRISMQLKLLQFLVIVGSALMVMFQSELPLWTPVVLAAVSSIEFVIGYQQLESKLPAVNATALAIMRVLIWWDGLSLIQQRMPASKDHLVDVVESALVMQHQGFVQGAIANLGKDLQDDKGGGGGGDRVARGTDSGKADSKGVR